MPFNVPDFVLQVLISELEEHQVCIVASTLAAPLLC